MSIIALIDGDIYAYQIASAAEKPIDWGDGLWTLHAFEEPACKDLSDRIEGLAHSIGADRIIIALSDSENWRKSVLPSYKSNRDHIRRPMLLKTLKKHLEDNFETFVRPTLEADDVLGILATGTMLKGDKIIVTIDKDLKTIPGLHYNSNHEDQGVFVVDEKTADNLHLYQALIGDTTDGYTGCPGIGPDTARKLLEDPHGWERYQHTFKSGKRAGETETRWKRVKVTSVWEAIVSHYIKAGLSEQEALIQARVARICRASDYNFKTKEVRLWTPKN